MRTEVSPPMLTIGLTGPSGAGKGYIAALFAAHGIPSIDTDAVYHALLVPPSPCLDELVARFGPTILTPAGTLDRPALAAIVFAPDAKSALDDLEHITHRHVLAEVRRRCTALAAADTPAVLVDAPRLYESGFDRECDKVLAVLASRATRLSRIMARDGLDETRATARLDAQKPDDFFCTHADAVIRNDPDAPRDILRYRENAQNHRDRDRGKTAENRGSTVGQKPQNPLQTPESVDCEPIGDLEAAVRRLLCDWRVCHEI